MTGCADDLAVVQECKLIASTLLDDVIGSGLTIQADGQRDTGRPDIGTLASVL